ncbi:dimethylsulfonioproprionate lyase family protein [Paracoccaceae bacterium]|nr:dimethylsulfonioproprionate lyase family protein [Paracoccaceae bacterium]MDB3948367.1 dimethylsulfonioproprionate lyase family protein [Paracoccaceae bacterium]
MQDNRTLSNFLAAAGKKFQTHPSDIAQEIYQALHSDLIPRQSPVVEAAPVDVSLSNFLKDRKSDLISLLLQCSDLLTWREAGFGKLPEEFAKRIFASEIIGPKGIIDNPSMRVGLLLQLDHVAYPKHWHSAEELYLILLGEAHWSVDVGSPEVRSPENFVHHKSNQPHSMTTIEEPLLAMWGWTGDIDGQSYSV